MRNGRLIYSEGFGSAHLDYEVPNTPRTIFGVASFSESFTSVAVAMLLDQGTTTNEDCGLTGVFDRERFTRWVC